MLYYVLLLIIDKYISIKNERTLPIPRIKK